LVWLLARECEVSIYNRFSTLSPLRFVASVDPLSVAESALCRSGVIGECMDLLPFRRFWLGKRARSSFVCALKALAKPGDSFTGGLLGIL